MIPLLISFPYDRIITHIQTIKKSFPRNSQSICQISPSQIFTLPNSHILIIVKVITKIMSRPATDRSFMKYRLFTILIAGALLLTGCGGNSSSGNPSTESNTAATASNEDASTENEPYILTFEASTIDGEALTSDIFADAKLTMINVWATYCNPCLSEMPDLGEIATEYDKTDFQMLGIISDVADTSDEKTISEAKELIKETGAATYPHLLLNQSLYSNLVSAVDGVPTTFFINQDSELLGYVVGAQSKETWEGIINELLAETE